MADVEPRITEAFTNLGFKPTDKRTDAFKHLVVQFIQDQDRHLETCQQEPVPNPLNLTNDDKLDIAAVNFVQHFGDDLWPVISWTEPNCQHLNGRWYVDTFTITRRCETKFVCEQDQNCLVFGANNRSLWEDKLRSPLGQAVRQYMRMVTRMDAAQLSHLRWRPFPELLAEVLSVQPTEFTRT
ncbi:hypothetical protein Slin14017_G039080 [Septoria linicola]|nr:hypothetical protein Slin14017_G039080 [Septoria linicola]